MQEGLVASLIATPTSLQGIDDGMLNSVIEKLQKIFLVHVVGELYVVVTVESI